jgi:phosphoglycerate dehydrogenase-like enzyme
MKLLLTGALKYTDLDIKQLQSLGYRIFFVKDETKPLHMDVSDIEVVVCNGLFMHNDIAQFKSLKLIQLTSAGLDRVPVDYINDKGIQLFNAKGVYSIPMAEWVLLKVLEIYKKSKKFYEAQREHRWEKQRELLELTGKTATIIGFGDVGSQVAKRLKAFGVHVIGVSRNKRESDLLDEHFTITDIGKALKRSNIVVITLPLTEETRHVIDTPEINELPDESVLVNVSRGAIINEVALINALERGKFMGVALDVFEEEPLSMDSPLWNYDRLIVTPHNSFVSDEVNRRMFQLLLHNLKSSL